jgi:hypothetical protein
MRHYYEAGEMEDAAIGFSCGRNGVHEESIASVLQKKHQKDVHFVRRVRDKTQQ